TVLVELGEHRHQGLHHCHLRVPILVERQRVLAVETVEGEVVDVCGCRGGHPQDDGCGERENGNEAGHSFEPTDRGVPRAGTNRGASAPELGCNLPGDVHHPSMYTCWTGNMTGYT